MKGTIMTEKIQRRGIKTPNAYKPDVLQSIPAITAMDDAPVLICTDNDMNDLRKWSMENIATYANDSFVVTDKDEKFKGYIQRSKLMNAHNDATLQDILDNDLPVVYKLQDLSVVSDIMGAYDMQIIAVISDHKNHKVEGIITSTDILQAYSNYNKKESHYQVSISLKRRTRRLIIRGRTYIQSKLTKEEA
jgi:predicted transcriptional regulator